MLLLSATLERKSQS